MNIHEKPTVMILGASGNTGRLIVQELARDPGDVHVRVCARQAEQVEKWRGEGRDAVLLDLDEPRTFGPALAGVDRVFLLTGYTVDMLVQSKTLVDAARKAGVGHIVHQGIFGNWDCTDPHFAWHQMIECYIRASGLAWTHLHPNVFMENLLGLFAPRDGRMIFYWGEGRVGWTALRDLAAVAAAVLRDGPERHGGQDYWLSSEVLTGTEVAATVGEVLGQELRAEFRSPENLARLMAETGGMEKKYAEGGVEFMRQVADGRMGYIATVRDDGPHVTGRAATSFRAWAEENRDTLRAASK